MGKNPPRVCNICGKEETTGWSSHKQRHNKVVNELLESQLPTNPKHGNWFERLSSNMQAKYAASNPELKDKQSQEEQKTISIDEQTNCDYTQFTSNGGSFQSFKKTKQQELEEKILFLQDKVNNPSLPSSREPSPDKKTMSGVTKYQSTTGQSHEQCNKLIDDKDKTILQINERVTKLEEKLERKDYELAQLKSQQVGQEVQCLKIELAEVRVRLEERDKQLMEWKAIADKLLKSKATFEKWKQEMEVLSVRSNTYNSQLQTPVQSEEENSHMDTNEPAFYCCYCDRYSTQLEQKHLAECDLFQQLALLVKDHPHWMKEISIWREVEPYCHISKSRFFNDMFDNFLQGLHESNEAVMIRKIKDDFVDIASEQQDQQESLINFHCELCKFNFISSRHKYQHWQDCPGLAKSVEYIRGQLQKYAKEANEKEAKLIQTTLKFDGTVLQKLDGFVKLSKTEELKNKAQQLFGKEYDWHMKFYEELRRPNYFNSLVQQLIVGPVVDTEGNPIFAQNTARENLIKMLGQSNKSRKSTASLENEVIILMKQQAGVPLTLDERRSLEAQDIKLILKQYEKDMLQIQDYLDLFKEMQLKDQFEKVDGIFCDGIILPRLQQLFSTYKDFEAAFHLFGIQVQKISPAQKEGFVYVRLLDSANGFTTEFAVKLKIFIQNLRKRLEEKNVTQEVLDGCFVKQIDCTQDIKGFFLSFDFRKDIAELSRLMKMDLTRDYHSFESLFTLLHEQNYGSDEQPVVKKQLRFKLYNKLLHFLESEQGKKKISMNLKALLNCSSQFYQKLLKCKDNGISRLEFSHYFYSFEESQLIDAEQYQQEIDNAFDQVNKLPLIRYKVSFKIFFDQFWRSSKPVFIFQKESWSVIYAKHSKSACIGQIVKINSNRFNTSDKTDCVKRFAIPGRWCTVIDEVSGKVFKVMKSGKKAMQIPIQSLNTIHSKSYDFDIDIEIFKYHLRDEELDQIILVLQSGNQFEFPDTDQQYYINSELFNKKREDKFIGKKKTKGSNNGIDISGLVKETRTKDKKRIKIFNELGTDIYGNHCQFSSKDNGISYICATCPRTIRVEGKQRIPFLFLS